MSEIPSLQVHSISDMI